jgi:hypothetical protein
MAENDKKVMLNDFRERWDKSTGVGSEDDDTGDTSEEMAKDLGRMKKLESKKCPGCGEILEPGARECPVCGERLKPLITTKIPVKILKPPDRDRLTKETE